MPPACELEPLMNNMCMTISKAYRTLTRFQQQRDLFFSVLIRQKCHASDLILTLPPAENEPYDFAKPSRRVNFIRNCFRSETVWQAYKRPWKLSNQGRHNGMKSRLTRNFPFYPLPLSLSSLPLPPPPPPIPLPPQF
jgi:hypothetical protein